MAHLRREIPPPSDLWPAIESQLDAAEGRKIWSVPSFLPLAAAAGIAAVLVTSLALLGSGCMFSPYNNQVYSSRDNPVYFNGQLLDQSCSPDQDGVRLLAYQHIGVRERDGACVALAANPSRRAAKYSEERKEISHKHHRQ